MKYTEKTTKDVASIQKLTGHFLILCESLKY